MKPLEALHKFGNMETYCEDGIGYKETLYMDYPEFFITMKKALERLAKIDSIDLDEVQKSWETTLEVMSGNLDVTPKELKKSLIVIQTLLDTIKR